MSFHDEVRAMLDKLMDQREHYERMLSTLPPGSLVKRTVKGHTYYYLVRREDGKVRTKYIGKLEPDELARYAQSKQDRDCCSEQLAGIEYSITSLERVSKLCGEDKERKLMNDGPDSTASNQPLERAPRRIVRRKRPLVVVKGAIPRDACIEIAHELEWDLLDIDLIDGILPQDLRPSGIISVDGADHPLIEQLSDMGSPAVRMGLAPGSGDARMPAVLLDMKQVGIVAAKHFLERGFKTMGHLGWNSELPTSLFHQAYSSFRQYAEDHGASVYCHSVEALPKGISVFDLTKFEHRTLGVLPWLDGLPKPIGILAINDNYASSLCLTCHNAGIDVPEAVAVLGVHNDTSVCEMTSPQLSSVDTAPRTATRKAMELLRDLMEGKPPPTKPIFIPPVGVVERQSTDLLAVKDFAVAQALRFMWDNSQSCDLSVDDIAEACGTGRRSLERVFKRETGRTMNEELRRKRLERCCYMLKTTDQSIADIAPLTGFRSTGYLIKVFRRAMGTTPRKWRASKRN